MRSLGRATPAFLIAALLAGCLEAPATVLDGPDPQPTTPIDWAARALVHEPDHLHNRSDHHVGLSTPNFQLVGWTPATRAGSSTMGGGGCGAAVSTPGRQLAVFTTGWDNAQGLSVADITDPANPKKVGEVVDPGFWFRDADITLDGRWAVGASFPNIDLPGPLLASDATQRSDDPCATDVPPPLMNQLGGVALIDLSDPSRPRVADFAPEASGGPHSVYATTIDGVHYVIGAYGGVPSDVGSFWFFTIEGGQLRPYGVHTFQVPKAQTAQPLFNLHTDAWIQKHPKTGQLLAYIANWDSGLVILRMDGPGRLVPIGGWSNYDPAKGREMTGQVHSVEVTDRLWDGKHYTFAGQEIIARPSNRPTGEVVMLDTTDPTQPKPVARWTLPVDTGTWDKKVMWCCLFSTHYLELVNQTLFIAMYHGGVWAIDARPSQGPELASLGVFVPTPPDPSYRSPNPTGPAPLIEEVYSLASGDLVTFDESGGLYTFRFDPQVVVPIPDRWTADSWLK